MTVDNPKRNARFWIFWRGGWVKLTLTKEWSVINLFDSRRTDEGFRCHHERYSLVDNYVDCQVNTRESDCDGKHEYHWHGRCKLWDLRVRLDNAACFAAFCEDIEDPLERPQWQKIDSHQRDQFAEMAGY